MTTLIWIKVIITLFYAMMIYYMFVSRMNTMNMDGRISANQEFGYVIIFISYVIAMLGWWR